MRKKNELLAMFGAVAILGSIAAYMVTNAPERDIKNGKMDVFMKLKTVNLQEWGLSENGKYILDFNGEFYARQNGDRTLFVSVNSPKHRGYLHTYSETHSAQEIEEAKKEGRYFEKLAVGTKYYTCPVDIAEFGFNEIEKKCEQRKLFNASYNLIARKRERADGINVFEFANGNILLEQKTKDIKLCRTI